MRVPLGSKPTLAQALRSLYDTDRPFALTGDWAGGGALLGCAPIRRTAADENDPFSVLRDVPRDPNSASVVGGGWVGYIGYPSRTGVHRGHPAPPRTHPLPPFSLAYYDHLVRVDNDGAFWFEALWTAERAEMLEERLTWWRDRIANPPQERAARTSAWRLTPSAQAHAELVNSCRERIHAGDLFQANVCADLVGNIEGEPLELFIRGVESLKPDRAAFLQDSWGAIVSLSPELYLERHGREVRSSPIKGTRPRSADPVLAAAERIALANSEKDRAENVMIVDLVRNDLGRVCVPGTIVADPLTETRAHAGVWHLVSEVRGTLRAGIDDGDLLLATFPPGSVTGAPKIAAMDVIAELESTEREVYTGAIGIASPMSGLELSVAIRTFEITGSMIHLGVGGGIVADSDPQAEAEELATKAAPLLRAVGAPPVSSGAPGRRLVPVRRLGPIPVHRPDPVRGVFETALVEGGQVTRLDAHLARLRSSLQALYGLDLPASAVGDILATAAVATGPARLRIDARPEAGAGIEIAIVTGELRPARAVDLRAWTVPGGLGPHKWADRGLVEALERHSPGKLPLLVDADGYVLEASTASIVALGRDGVVRTAPDDGRILPSLSRALLLGHAEQLGLPVDTSPLALDELVQARAVVLTSALRQYPAASLDGRELAQDPELTILARAAMS